MQRPVIFSNDVGWSFCRVNRALVTGANGRLGQLLCVELEKNNFEVFRVVREGSLVSDANTLAINLFHRNYNQDPIQDSRLLEFFREIKPDVVFHTAGTIVTNDPLQYYENNILATVQLVQVLQKIPSEELPLFVNLSSAAELGRVPETCDFVTEEFHCKPISEYGVSKLCQTEIILSASKRLGFRCICARIFNVIGLPHSSHMPVQSWVDQLKSMKERKVKSPVLQVGNLDVIRDFLDSSELIRILIELSISTSSEANGIINVGSGVGVRLSDVIETLRELWDEDFDVCVDPNRMRTQDIKNIVASTAKLEKVIGRSVQFNLKSSLKKLL